MATRYTKEFKQEAVRLSEQVGVAAASEKLGVSQKALYEWQRKQRLERGEAPEGLRPNESLEQGFKRQEKEIRELRDANYILKKAMGFMVGR
jgi:transposase